MISYTWVVPTYLDDATQFAIIRPVSDILPTLTETVGHTILQPVIDPVRLSDDIPAFHIMTDAIAFNEDVSILVAGAQKTIYITDERYIIRHDFG